eukprot:7210191-Prymnesium_polylepis.1
MVHLRLLVSLHQTNKQSSCVRTHAAVSSAHRSAGSILRVTNLYTVCCHNADRPAEGVGLHFTPTAEGTRGSKDRARTSTGRTGTHKLQICITWQNSLLAGP